jgi:hypothetical protein
MNFEPRASAGNEKPAMPRVAKGDARPAEPIKQISPKATKALGNEVRQLFPSIDKDVLSALLVDLQPAICAFCEFELNPPSRYLAKLRGELGLV